MKLSLVLACAGLVAARFLSKDGGTPIAKTSEATAAGLEKMLLRMASEKDASSAPNDFVTALTPLLSQMEAAVNASHTAAELMVNNLTIAVTTCTGTQTTGQGLVEQKQTTMDTAFNEHTTCRTSEGAAKTEYDSCVEVQAVLDGAKDTACDSLAQMNVLASLDELPPISLGELRNAWLPRLKVYVDAQVLSLTNADESCQNSTSALAVKSAECVGTDGSGGLKGEWTGNRSECDTKQSTMESATCNFADEAEDSCAASAMCHNTTKTLWDNLVPNLRAEEASRHSEWWMIQRIRCYLHVLQEADGSTVNGSAMIVCQNAEYNTSFLNLTYPDLPAAPGSGICAFPINTPCSPDYNTTVYSSLPANAPPKTCTPCDPVVTTTLTTTSTLPATTVAPVPAGVTLPPGWPKVVGQGSWYGQPGVKLSPAGTCNGNYVWSAYNMLYNCRNGGVTSWLPADCGYRLDCPNKMWFTFDLGAVHHVQNVKVWPQGLGGYRSNVYEILFSTTSAGPVGPYSAPFPAFTTTSQGFTQVVHNDCGNNCDREIEHVVNQQARYVMFHAIEWNNDRLRSAGVKYMTVTVDGGL